MSGDVPEPSELEAPKDARREAEVGYKLRLPLTAQQAVAESARFLLVMAEQQGLTSAERNALLSGFAWVKQCSDQQDGAEQSGG